MRQQLLSQEHFRRGNATPSLIAARQLSHLLPAATGFRLDSCHLDQAQTEISLILTSWQMAIHCPLCHMPARRLHSRYRRTLADLPWGSYRVKLWLRHLVEQRRRGVDPRAAGAASRPAGDGGAGKQDGAHRLGADDAQGDLPGDGTRRGRSGSHGVTSRHAR